MVKYKSKVSGLFVLGSMHHACSYSNTHTTKKLPNTRLEKMRTNTILQNMVGIICQKRKTRG
jgi:hypothetical protein